jgi:hypothetical protein
MFQAVNLRKKRVLPVFPGKRYKKNPMILCFELPITETTMLSLRETITNTNFLLIKKTPREKCMLSGRNKN